MDGPYGSFRGTTTTRHQTSPAPTPTPPLTCALGRRRSSRRGRGAPRRVPRRGGAAATARRAGRGAHSRPPHPYTRRGAFAAVRYYAVGQGTPWDRGLALGPGAGLHHTQIDRHRVLGLRECTRRMSWGPTLLFYFHKYDLASRLHKSTHSPALLPLALHARRATRSSSIVFSVFTALLLHLTGESRHLCSWAS